MVLLLLLVAVGVVETWGGKVGGFLTGGLRNGGLRFGGRGRLAVQLKTAVDMAVALQAKHRRVQPRRCAC